MYVILHSLPLAASVSRWDVTPGLLGFALFAFLGVAVFFLVRSMNKHLKRIRVDRDE